VPICVLQPWAAVPQFFQPSARRRASPAGQDVAEAFGVAASHAAAAHWSCRWPRSSQPLAGMLSHSATGPRRSVAGATAAGIRGNVRSRAVLHTLLQPPQLAPRVGGRVDGAAIWCCHSGVACGANGHARASIARRARSVGRSARRAARAAVVSIGLVVDLAAVAQHRVRQSRWSMPQPSNTHALLAQCPVALAKAVVQFRAGPSATCRSWLELFEVLISQTVPDRPVAVHVRCAARLDLKFSERALRAYHPPWCTRSCRRRSWRCPCSVRLAAVLVAARASPWVRCRI